jgi:hypothetical protein
VWLTVRPSLSCAEYSRLMSRKRCLSLLRAMEMRPVRHGALGGHDASSACVRGGGGREDVSRVV